jgi:hypothetical protein
MKNLRRLALISGIAALSAVAFNPKAQAQQAQEVTFSATVAKSCSFGTTVSGTLIAANGWVEASGGSLSGLNLGTAGSTIVSCNSPATISTATPVTVSVPTGFVDTNRQAIVYDTENTATVTIASSFTGSSRLWDYNNASFTIPADSSRLLKVAMNAGSTAGSAVPAGTYSYTVSVTATPN